MSESSVSYRPLTSAASLIGMEVLVLDGDARVQL